MIKKKKFMYSIVGIAIASAVFTTTAFTNVLTSAGYDNYKKALVKTVTTVENFTLTSAVRVDVDGKTMQSSSTELKTDGKYQSSRNSNTYDGGAYENHFITQKNYTASKHNNMYSDDENYAVGDMNGKWTAYRVDETSDRVYYPGGFSNRLIGSVTPTQIRFYELLADTLTGDTKNYVITNGNNVSISLAENQVPEIAHLGLAAIVEANNRFRDEDNIDEDFPISKDIMMKNFSLNATLTDDGYINDTELNIVLSGKDFKNNMHEIIVKFSFAFTNIGTTVPDSLDEATLNQALTNANIRTKTIEEDNANIRTKTIEEDTENIIEIDKPEDIENIETKKDEDKDSMDENEADTDAADENATDADATDESATDADAAGENATDTNAADENLTLEDSTDEELTEAN